MKKILYFFLICSIAVSVSAQSNESKDELFSKIAKLTQKKKPEDTEKAYQLAKDYLARFGKDNDEKTKKIKDFVEKYRLAKFNESLDSLNMQAAMNYAKDILAENPEDSYVTMNLALGGFDLYVKNQDNSIVNQTIDYAKQTLQLFDKGKLPREYTPLKNKEDAQATMYYIIGMLSINSDIKEATGNFYRAVSFNSQIKSKAYPYYVIALYYEKVYESASEEFRKKHQDNITSDAEFEKDRQKINLIIDRMIDAYARAVNLGTIEKHPSVDMWRQRLTEAYKFRHNTDSTLEDYIKNIMNKEMPDPFNIQ